MPTAYSDFLFTPAGSGNLTPWAGVWIRLVSNNTGTAYVSDAATDGKGKFTFATKPPGDSYTVYTGPSSVGAWTATGAAGYAVPYVAGDNAVFQSQTDLASGSYVATGALAGSVNNDVWAAKPTGVAATDGPNFLSAWNTCVARILPTSGASVNYLTATARLRLWPGEYNLTTLSGLETPDAATFAFWIEGSGKELTRLLLNSAAYLIDTAYGSYHGSFKGIQSYGGLGVFRSRFAGINVGQLIIFEDNIFIGYTVCAISQNSSDWPYWKVRRNVFDGTSATSIGVALGGDVALDEIAHNAFIRNRYHIKLGQDGAQNLDRAHIHHNDFVRFDAYGAVARTDIWIVPSTFVGGGQGMGIVVEDNNFGDENLNAADFKILIAASGAGTFIGDTPHSVNQGVGILAGTSVVRNRTKGVVPLITSYTDLLYGLNLGPNSYIGGTGAFPASKVRFVFGTTTADKRLQTSVAGPDYVDLASASTGNAPGMDAAPIPFSNLTGEMGFVLDPAGLSHADSGQISQYPGGLGGVEFVDLTNQVGINAATLAGGATKVTGTDSIGYVDAATLTLPAAGIVRIPLVGVVAGKPIRIEVDWQSGGATPLAGVLLQIQDNVPNVHWRRHLPTKSYWQRRSWWYFPKVSANLSLAFANPTGSSGTVNVGRIMVYHEREAVPMIVAPYRHVYPGGETGAIQTVGGLLHSTGIPSNANGNNKDWGFSDNGRLYFKSSGVWVQRLTSTEVDLADAATINTDWSQGSVFTVAPLASPRTMAAPTNATDGQMVTYEIFNNTGGVLVTTWDAAFRLGAAWTDPAAARLRRITFLRTAGAIRELTRTTADGT